MQRSLPCILLKILAGSCRLPGHSEDVVLQGPEAVADSAIDNVLELRAMSSTATGLAFLALSISQCLSVLEAWCSSLLRKRPILF